MVDDIEDKKEKEERKETKRIDKQSLVIIAFIAMFGISAAFFAMGIGPEIFRQGEQIDLAVIQQHEDEARANQTTHEDLARDLQFALEQEARANQTQHEDEAREKQNALENAARDKQRYQIVSETNLAIKNLGEELKHFISESENRSASGAADRKEILDKLNTALDNQEAQLSKQNTQLNLMAGQQDAIDNSTRNTLEVLKKLSNATSQIHLDNKALLENITKNIQELN